jgi:hypothetical protein
MSRQMWPPVTFPAAASQCVMNQRHARKHGDSSSSALLASCLSSHAQVALVTNQALQSDSSVPPRCHRLQGEFNLDARAAANNTLGSKCVHWIKVGSLSHCSDTVPLPA